jgi:hypothetical protein
VVSRLIQNCSKYIYILYSIQPFGTLAFCNLNPTCSHHGQKSHASGFCYVADCVLAILALKRPVPLSSLTRDGPQATSRKPRIMYLDLDLHFSDGVSQAFHSTSTSTVPQVLVSFGTQFQNRANETCGRRYRFIMHLQDSFPFHHSLPSLPALQQQHSPSHSNQAPHMELLPAFGHWFKEFTIPFSPSI